MCNGHYIVSSHRLTVANFRFRYSHLVNQFSHPIRCHLCRPNLVVLVASSAIAAWRPEGQGRHWNAVMSLNREYDGPALLSFDLSLHLTYSISFHEARVWILWHWSWTVVGHLDHETLKAKRLCWSRISQVSCEIALNLKYSYCCLVELVPGELSTKTTISSRVEWVTLSY